jgi:hypothetical protein
LRTIITPRRTIEIGEQAQKPSRAVRTGMKTGGEIHSFSRTNLRKKFEGNTREKCKSASSSNIAMWDKNAEKEPKTPVSHLLPRFCGELLWNEDFAATTTP